MSNRPKLSTWNSFASAIVGLAIFLFTLGVLDLHGIIWTAILFSLFLINKFSPWKYRSWDEPLDPAGKTLRTMFTAWHLGASILLLGTCFFWLFQEWGCNKVSVWFHDRCTAYSEDHRFHEYSWRLENRALRNGLEVELPPGETYVAVVVGNEVRLMTSRETVEHVTEPICNMFDEVPSWVLLVTIVFFMLCLLGEGLANLHFKRTAEDPNEPSGSKASSNV